MKIYQLLDPQHAGDHIIKDDGAGAHENDENVGIGIVVQVGRRVGDVQDPAGAEKGQGSDQHRGDQAKPDTLAAAAAYCRHVTGTEALGDGDGKAGADAQGKAQHQKVQRACGTHGGKGRGAQHAAHDDAVGQIIKLLKKIADQQWNTKCEDLPDGRAFGHISCHGEPSLLVSHDVL